MDANSQQADALWEAFKAAPSAPQGPRGLRDVIPAGKGRVAVDEYLARVRRGQTCGMQSMLLLHQCEHSRRWDAPAECAIVGGGPSLQAEVAELRRLVKRGVKIVAVNKSHDWLLRRGFPVHYAALLDPKEWVAGYINPSMVTRRAKVFVQPRYLIASQCNDDTIAKFLAPGVREHSYMWHAAGGVGESEMLRTEFANDLWVNIAGASVIGLRAIGLAHGLGFRKMRLFGIDGSAKMPPWQDLRRLFDMLVVGGNIRWTGGEPQRDQIVRILLDIPHAKTKLPKAANEMLRKLLYTVDKPMTDPTWSPFEVKLTSGWNRPFLSNHHMARSVYEFEDAMVDWDKQIKAEKMEPFNVIVHGDPEYSAIAMVAAGMGIHADAGQNEKYGKPPTRKAT